MYGTIFHLKPKPGMMDAVVNQWDVWRLERGESVRGAIIGLLFQSVANPEELMSVAVFESRESYFANADDPEQDRWYRELVELLEEPPVFEDGRVLRSLQREQTLDGSSVQGL